MSSVPCTYMWRLLWRDSQHDEAGNFYGHSFYLDAVSGRIAVKDMSGDFPHETDDGVLWIDAERPVRFSVGDRHDRGGGFASLPVVCERSGNGRSSISMRWNDAIATVRTLRCWGVHMAVAAEPAIGGLMALMIEAATLAKEKGGVE